MSRTHQTETDPTADDFFNETKRNFFNRFHSLMTMDDHVAMGAVINGNIVGSTYPSKQDTRGNGIYII